MGKLDDAGGGDRGAGGGGNPCGALLSTLGAGIGGTAGDYVGDALFGQGSEYISTKSASRPSIGDGVIITGCVTVIVGN